MRATIPIHLTDQELLSEAKRFARCESEATAQLVAHLAEIDARRLYLGAGYSSLFTYCCQVLALSESATFNRIEAARAARRFPIILEMLSAATVSLTAVRLLAPYLTSDNHTELLAAADGRSKREVQELLARRFPRPDVAPSIRRLPTDRSAPAIASSSVDGVAPPAEETTTGPHSSSTLTGVESTPPSGSAAAQSAPSPAPVAPAGAGKPDRRHQPLATPLSIDRYQIRFTASTATWEKLRLARDLLRHAVPSGDPAEIIDRALSVLLADLAKKKCAAVKTPRSQAPPTGAASRHVPARVRRVVWLRDQGRCAYVAPSGRRCGERAFLEFHHVHPYSAGGQATVANIQLRCSSHNKYEAVLFGESSGRDRVSVPAEPAPRPAASRTKSIGSEIRPAPRGIAPPPSAHPG